MCTFLKSQKSRVAKTDKFEEKFVILNYKVHKAHCDIFPAFSISPQTYNFLTLSHSLQPHQKSICIQVTVVVVFLVCHSVKLFINGYEVYQLVKSNVEKANQEPPRLSMNITNTTEAGITDEESIEQR